MRHWLMCTLLFSGCAVSSQEIPPNKIDPSSFVRSGKVNQTSIFTLNSRSTGFLMSPTGCFLTTYHQFSKLRQMGEEPTTLGFKLIPLRFWPEHDLVLYKSEFKFKSLPHLKLSGDRYQLRPGEKVLAIGVKSGPVVLEADDPSEGLKEINERGKTVHRLGYSLLGKLQDRDSGSPVINSKGEAIAIVISGSEESEAITAIPVYKRLLFSSEAEEQALCK